MRSIWSGREGRGRGEKKSYGCTVEVIVEGMLHTFIRSIKGKNMGEGRTDGEKCEIRKRT